MKQNLQEVKRLQQLAGIVNEEFRLSGSDNEGMDGGIYIELKRVLTPDQKKEVIQRAQDEIGIDVVFMKSKANKNAVYVHFAGDYSNVVDLLQGMNIPIL